ncbi:MAG: tRNA (adenosine(37)-N6)-dimethylallyltransferase MiaA [Lentimicrobium sp.]|nr:tRNA (adenosine(37)-N6)-dimethylallyltransferase MiaA [Lentimicrobium sp.]
MVNLTVPPPEENTLLIIAGPTAVGKTSVSIAVASYFGCSIISADSRQFFKELKIGAAAPTPEQLAQVKHHFVGNLSLADDYNVSRYEQEVLSLLPILFQEKRLVVLTGGSGLYIKAVCEGIDELPDADPAIRESLFRKFEEDGLPGLRAMLQKSDPDYYRVVDLANPNRIIRALEVCLATGKPYSGFRKQEPAKRNFRIIKIGLDLPRELLHLNINTRVDQMMAEGLEQEVRSLYPQRQLNSLNTVGYKELFDYFEGKCSRQEAIEKIKTNTRRYARRQLTWFHKDKEISWCKPEAREVISLAEHLLKQKGQVNQTI